MHEVHLPINCAGSSYVAHVIYHCMWIQDKCCVVVSDRC